MNFEGKFSWSFEKNKPENDGRFLFTTEGGIKCYILRN